MPYVELDVVSWEPSTVCFDFTPNPIPSSFADVVLEWLKTGRQGLSGCRCSFRDFRFSPTQGCVTVLTGEWLCRECLAALSTTIEAQFPLIARISLGLKLSEPAVAENPLIRVEDKHVEFEDGTRRFVKAFTIGRRPVTVREFQEFAKATNYKTVAELCSSNEVYYDNGRLSGLSKEAIMEASVYFVAFVDAEAFCKFSAKYRLPTEEEWFAASVIDSNDAPVTGTYRRRLEIMKRENALEFSGSEITSSRTGDNLVIARRGPRYFLRQGWRQKERFERQLLDPSYGGIQHTFRVVLR